MSRSLPLSAQRCLNAFVEMEDPIAPTAAFCVPGLTARAICGVGPVRWGYVKGVTYFVSGSDFILLSGTQRPNLTARDSTGGIDAGQSRTMVRRICIVWLGRGLYLHIDSGNFEQISDPNFYPANGRLFSDTYLCSIKSAQRIFRIGPNNGLALRWFDVCERRSRKRSDYRRCD